MVNWREEAVRSGILFGISVLLVAGFWFHSEFYQIGFYPLLLAGGFATFLVIAGARYAVTGRGFSRAPRMRVSVPLEDGERILQRRATLAILPVETPVPPAGSTAVLAFETGADLGRFRIVDAYRKILGDLTVEEARSAGFRSLEDLQVARRARGGWAPESVVLVARLAPARGEAR